MTRYALIMSLGALAIAEPAWSATCGQHSLYANVFRCAFTEREPILGAQSSHMLSGGTITLYLSFNEVRTAPLEVVYYLDNHWDEYNRDGVLMNGNTAETGDPRIFEPGHRDYVISMSIGHPSLSHNPRRGTDPWDPWASVWGQGWANFEFGAAPNSFTWSYEWTPIRRTLTLPVPEPATWAMMIVGFGAVGATLRRRRGIALEGTAGATQLQG